jgi:hypothetical protein
MSVEAMAIVLNHSAATGTAKIVLLGIANHEGDGGSWPSVPTLARYANADDRTVQRAIDKLIKSGELSRQVHQGGDRRTRGGRFTNLYRVLVVCPDNCDRTPNHRLIHRGDAHATPQASRGDAHATPGVTPTPPEPSENHPLPTAPEKSHVGNRASGHKHQFAVESGYCVCGYRDDGRLLDAKSGLQFQPPASERRSA